MRDYPHNSPQAAARVLALALVADGRLQAAEMRTLARSHAHERLGLSEGELHAVVHALCDDMVALARSEGSDTCVVDPETLARLFGEVSDPALRRKVLRLVMLSVRADRRLHEGEMRILLAAIDHWALRPEGLEDLLPPPELASSRATPPGRPSRSAPMSCAP